MARGTSKDGFDLTNIVKTAHPKTTETKSAVAVKEPKAAAKATTKTVTKPAATATNKTTTNKTAIVEKVTTEPPVERFQKMIYLTADQKKTLAKYGRKIGKAQGGASRIVADALNEYFANHPL